MAAPATVPARWADLRPEVFVPRAQVPPALLAAEADTLGWDVVHALRLPQVNAELAAGRRWPATFQQEMQEGWRLAGSFGTWQLVRGGSNSIVFLRADLRGASMTFPRQPDLHLEDGWVTVAIKLQYLPQPPGGGATSTPEEGAEFLAARSTSPDPDDPPAVVQAVGYGTTTPTAVQDAAFRAALARWFCGHLDLLTHVFCVVDVNRRATGDFQWLRPTWTGYAYANGPTDDTSTFGVLTMTSQGEPVGCVNQLGPAAVPPGCTSAVLVSQGSFLRHLMVPGLTRALAGTVVEDFVLETGTVRTVRPIRLADVESGGTTYEPVLEKLDLQVVGDEVQLRTLVRTGVSPGIDAFVDATDTFRVTLVDKPDGTQTLSFVPSREPQRREYTQKEPWVVVTEILVGIIGAVTAIVAGVVIPGAGAAMVAVLVIGLVAGLAAATPTLIALVAGGDAAAALPSIGELLTQATVDVRWPGSSGLRLRSVELNGALQMGGDLVPAREGEA